MKSASATFASSNIAGASPVAVNVIIAVRFVEWHISDHCLCAPYVTHAAAEKTTAIAS